MTPAKLLSSVRHELKLKAIKIMWEEQWATKLSFSFLVEVCWILYFEQTLFYSHQIDWK